MANRTMKNVETVHGTNPQFLISRIVRLKVYSTLYWKEKCFGLTASSIVDRGVQLQYIAGTYGGIRKPSAFLCLVLKLLQIQPERRIILEYLHNKEFKYLSALAAFYIRLTAKGKDIYQHLEPLLSDYRRLRVRDIDGRFRIIHMDEFIDDLLQSEHLLDIDFPQLPKREVLESSVNLPQVIPLLHWDTEVAAFEKAEQLVLRDEKGDQVAIKIEGSNGDGVKGIVNGDGSLK